MQKLDIRDNPKLVLPPRPKEQVKGSGAEWYNIDFDPEILKKGAVVAASKVLKGEPDSIVCFRGRGVYVLFYRYDVVVLLPKFDPLSVMR